MIPFLRKEYNDSFLSGRYQSLISEIEKDFPGKLDFRLAETPVFIPRGFTEKILDTCEHIIDEIVKPSFIASSNASIPPNLHVPGEDAHTHFIAFDFGICSNEKGELEPQLIEMQGFPSLFAFQALLPEYHAKHLYQPAGFSNYLNGFDKENYLELLRKIIIGDEKKENVVLLEILPDQQKTRIDFACTENYLGIKTVCLTELVNEGKKLFYQKDGKKIQINRIYNRIIFDDLDQQSDEIKEKGEILTKELDVKWIPHPSWFYRISKFTLPFIRHPYVPYTQFLNNVPSLPHDLENYVVKPLFSFAGQGVIIDVTREQVEGIKDPENWILQRKVNYAAAIETPGEPAKAEVRIFYFWEEGAERPVATNNLARLSKGKMVGTRYNKNKEWVGGSFALFEK